MKLYKAEFTQQKYNELVSYANSNNCIIEDKGDYYETVEIEIIEPTLEELKQEKIQQLKNNCSNCIYAVYPLFKQINLVNGLYTEQEKTEYDTFISEKRTLCDTKEQEILNASTVEEINNINIEF